MKPILIRKRPETIYFLGFTLYCTRNQKGNFKVGLRTEKSRLQRSLTRMQDLMRRMRHLPVKEQVINLNRVLRGHYACYGVAGNFRALQRVYRAVERCWQRMLGRRSRAGQITWEVFHRINSGIRYCDQSYTSHTGSCRRSQCCEPIFEERSAGNPHATFCGSRRRATASGDLVTEGASPPPTRFDASAYLFGFSHFGNICGKYLLDQVDSR